MNRIETIEVLYFLWFGRGGENIQINKNKLYKTKTKIKKKKGGGGSVGTLSRYIKKNALSFMWIENTYSKRLKKMQGPSCE